ARLGCVRLVTRRWGRQSAAAAACPARFTLLVLPLSIESWIGRWTVRFRDVDALPMFSCCSRVMLEVSLNPRDEKATDRHVRRITRSAIRQGAVHADGLGGRADHHVGWVAVGADLGACQGEYIGDHRTACGPHGVPGGR